jgi:pyridinium-3,5-bisthiocarboxylic acid mononucleotide nickel chelatase
MIAYLDLWTGLSGDMMIGALLGAGWPEEGMREILKQIALPEARVIVESRQQHTLSGLGIRVEATSEPPDRSHREIRTILEQSSLTRTVREKCLALFRRLAEVEAAIHGIDVDQVHFHELGATDSIVDIVLAVAGLEGLGVTRLSSGPVPLSRGEVMTAHGKLPVPAPATLKLLEGLPVRWLPIEGEWLTPTGALLLSCLADFVDQPPEMWIAKVGIGAGTRLAPDRANIVRLIVGEPSPAAGGGSPTGLRLGHVSVLEANLDDMDPRLEAEAVAILEKGGALDVLRTPILMKKGRKGTLLTVICRPEQESELAGVMLEQTTTLGVRIRREFRHELDRWMETVTTSYGPVRVKWSRPGGRLRPIPEFEDIRERSREHGVPGWEVVNATFTALSRGAEERTPRGE